jgi:hypothetical protein
MPNQPSTAAPPDRRQRFRTFMKRFNPTASAKAAIGEGLICQYAGRSVFKKLAAGADLTVGSQQLLVGGIGSGKTTELMLAQRELAGNEHMLPLYIDVSAETDLSTVNSGALLASLGMHTWGAVASKFNPPESLSAVQKALRKAAYGFRSMFGSLSLIMIRGKTTIQVKATTSLDTIRRSRCRVNSSLLSRRFEETSRSWPA